MSSLMMKGLDFVNLEIYGPGSGKFQLVYECSLLYLCPRCSVRLCAAIVELLVQSILPHSTSVARALHQLLRRYDF
jgi:hypothetical protein